MLHTVRGWRVKRCDREHVSSERGWVEEAEEHCLNVEPQAGQKTCRGKGDKKSGPKIQVPLTSSPSQLRHLSVCFQETTLMTPDRAATEQRAKMFWIAEQSI